MVREKKSIGGQREKSCRPIRRKVTILLEGRRYGDLNRGKYSCGYDDREGACLQRLPQSIIRSRAQNLSFRCLLPRVKCLASRWLGGEVGQNPKNDRVV